MNDKISDNSDQEQEVFPLEPRYHPIHKIPRKIYDFLASAKLAMVLLVTILVCCILGVTVWHEAEAGRVIFGTYWFNGILVLLVVNVACCFFGRIWRRRITLISFGMILFHLSFVAILLGIVYNSLFCFRGVIRLTEGETLVSSDPNSYDSFDHGVLFNFSRLRGETTLVKMHAGHLVAGEDKRAAYEVTVGQGADKKSGLLYITNKLVHRGVEYLNEREGYSLLLVLFDKQGQELYGGHLPLQSISGKDGSYTYLSGTKDGNIIRIQAIPFPVPPEKPLVAVQVGYLPSKLKERAGEADFSIYPLGEKGSPDLTKKLISGKSPIGDILKFGDYGISAREVRYWVTMAVRYEPGKPLVLVSLWTGLAGMIITTLGRMLRTREREQSYRKK